MAPYAIHTPRCCINMTSPPPKAEEPAALVAAYPVDDEPLALPLQSQTKWLSFTIFILGVLCSNLAQRFLPLPGGRAYAESSATTGITGNQMQQFAIGDEGQRKSKDFVLIIDNALSAEFCDNLIQKFEADQRRVQGRTGSGKLDKKSVKKLSTDLPLTEVPDSYSDEIYQIRMAANNGLTQYVDEYPHFLFGAVSPRVYNPDTNEIVDLDEELYPRVGRGDAFFENMRKVYRHGHINLQKYEQNKGHYQAWHSEIMPHWEDDGDTLHRVLFYMIYLNDVEEGGTTDFKYQNLQIRPKKGRLVIAPGGFTHTHRGNSPTSGDKYIVTSWLMFKNTKQLGWDKYKAQ